MTFSIERLTEEDIQSVDALMKMNSTTLGFLPSQALSDYANKGGIIGARATNGHILAYLLFSSYPDYFRIVHLCVAEQCRGKNIARDLISELRSIATTQTYMRLRCRRDFPAHKMWPHLGFIPMVEKPGRSAAGHALTLWYLPIAPSMQLDLFQSLLRDENINVVIDAQIFFDLYEPDSTKTVPSKSLLSGHLVDNLFLWVTDELLVEIDRSEDQQRRRKSSRRVHSFPNVDYDPLISSDMEKKLRTLLPSKSKSQLSDIRHLSKTAASNLKTFVTRDSNLLKHADEIENLLGIQVLSPAKLLIDYRNFTDKGNLNVARISGQNLLWSDLHPDDLSGISEFGILDPGERSGRVKERLNAYLAEPEKYSCQLLQLGDAIVALRVLHSGADEMTCHMLRIGRMAGRTSIDRFVIADTLAGAVVGKKKVVHVLREGVGSALVDTLVNMGFWGSHGRYTRLVIPEKMNRLELVNMVSTIAPDLDGKIRACNDSDLEKHCSPVCMTGSRPSFLIPIKPGYAMGLFDAKQAMGDLFGDESSTLLRWENVYYRKPSHKSMIRAPGRIFWYLSQPRSAIVAVSHLDEVVLGKPKELFRLFEKFGVLDWRAIYTMCDGDVSADLMALRFSHTFSFRDTVSLVSLRRIAGADGKNLVLQSPSALSDAVCRKIIEAGFGT